MAKAKPRKRESDEIKIEPGADERLAGILKKALNTPPPRRNSPVTKKRGGKDA